MDQFNFVLFSIIKKVSDDPNYNHIEVATALERLRQIAMTHMKLSPQWGSQPQTWSALESMIQNAIDFMGEMETASGSDINPNDLVGLLQDIHAWKH